MDELSETASELRKQYGLQVPATISEEAILEKLAERVMVLINEGADAFFQLMYRLDIPEKQLMSVARDTDAPYKIARLIYDRQLQKVRSREYYRNNNISDDADLRW